MQHYGLAREGVLQNSLKFDSHLLIDVKFTFELYGLKSMFVQDIYNLDRWPELMHRRKKNPSLTLISCSPIRKWTWHTLRFKLTSITISRPSVIRIATV